MSRPPTIIMVSPDDPSSHGYWGSTDARSSWGTRFDAYGFVMDTSLLDRPDYSSGPIRMLESGRNAISSGAVGTLGYVERDALMNDLNLAISYLKDRQACHALPTSPAAAELLARYQQATGDWSLPPNYLAAFEWAANNTRNDTGATDA